VGGPVSISCQISSSSEGRWEREDPGRADGCCMGKKGSGRTPNPSIDLLQFPLSFAVREAPGVNLLRLRHVLRAVTSSFLTVWVVGGGGLGEPEGSTFFDDPRWRGVQPSPVKKITDRKMAVGWLTPPPFPPLSPHPFMSIIKVYGLSSVYTAPENCHLTTSVGQRP